MGTYEMLKLCQQSVEEATSLFDDGSYDDTREKLRTLSQRLAWELKNKEPDNDRTAEQTWSEPETKRDSDNGQTQPEADAPAETPPRKQSE